MTLIYPADETWQGFVGVHGGVLTGALLAAAREVVPGLAATVTAHFLAPVPPGDLRVEASVVHPGRTAAVSAGIGAAVTGLVRVVRDASASVKATPAWPVPDPSPAPDDLPLLDLPQQLVPIGQHLEIRPVSDTRPLAGGDDPAFDVWIRLRPPVPFGAQETAAVLLDALPPGLFATLRAPVAIPTAEFTAHFTPATYGAGDWFRLRQRTAWASDALCVDEAELRTWDGTLAAQARQLRRIHAPR